MSMNPVVHFELPADDRKRMVDFYTKAFGWNATQLGPEMNNYVTVQTSETGADGMPAQPGMINGGLFDRNPEAKVPSIVIAVEDINAHIEKVKEAGGTVHGEPMEIPGIGMFASFTDTEGNRLSMLQPGVMM